MASRFFGSRPESPRPERKARSSVFSHQEHSLDIAFNRLCSGRTAPDDPGFEAVSAHPPTLDELRAYFISERDRYEIATAQSRREKNA